MPVLAAETSEKSGKAPQVEVGLGEDLQGSRCVRGSPSRRTEIPGPSRTLNQPLTAPIGMKVMNTSMPL